MDSPDGRRVILVGPSPTSLSSSSSLFSPRIPLPRYIYLLAAFPALLLTVLLFMDQQITSVIVNRKEHKLKVHLTSSPCPTLPPPRKVQATTWTC